MQRKLQRVTEISYLSLTKALPIFLLRPGAAVLVAPLILPRWSNAACGAGVSASKSSVKPGIRIS